MSAVELSRDEANLVSAFGFDKPEVVADPVVTQVIARLLATTDYNDPDRWPALIELTRDAAAMVSLLSGQLAESRKEFRDYKINHHENEHDVVALRAENDALRQRIDRATASIHAEKVLAELLGFRGVACRLDNIIAALAVPTEVEEKKHGN